MGGDGVEGVEDPLELFARLRRVHSLRHGPYPTPAEAGFAREALGGLDAAAADLEQKRRPVPAGVHAARGEALVLLSAGNTQALHAGHAALSTALRLQPSLADVWCAMGDCLSELASHREAARSYETAVQRGAGAEALRGLSGALRRMPQAEVGQLTAEIEAAAAGADPVALGFSPQSTPGTRVAASVAHAKRAVALGLEDADSWHALGNAHLASFFAGAQDPADLVRALAAYNRAVRNWGLSGGGEKDKQPQTQTQAQTQKGGNGDGPGPAVADLHHNRGCVLAYLSRHAEALDAFRDAVAADPGMDASRAEAARIESLVKRTGEVLSTRAGMNAKVIRRLTAKIPSDKSDLNGVPLVNLAQLAAGPPGVEAGRGKVVMVAVAAALTGPHEVPMTVAVVDAEGTFGALTMYNIAVNGAGCSDVIAIVDPAVDSVATPLADGTVLTFPRITCSDIRRVKINGANAKAALTTFTMERR